MTLKCNITRTGRVSRLTIGLVAIIPAIALAQSQSGLSLLVVGGLAVGAFTIFEAAKGWCIIVHTLERMKAGITRKRILRLLLGSST